MRNFLVIWRRELGACLLSPIATVSLVVFLAASGVTFLVQVVNNVGSDGPLAVHLFASILFWQTFLITVISMRMFAEERRSGTLEALLTAPVTDAQVVLGKYVGGLSFLWIVTLPAVAQIFLLAWLSPGIEWVDIGALLSGVTILLLVSAFCMAIGLAVSLFTRNQIVAAVCTFCVIWGALLAGWMIASLPGGLEGFGNAISVLGHVETFSHGFIDTRPIVLNLSLTWMLLFASVRVLESRRWR